MRSRRPLPIRLRLALLYSSVLALGLILFGLALWVLLKHSLYEDLQKELGERSRSMQAFVATEASEPGVHLMEELQEYSQALPDGTHFWLYDERNQRAFSSEESFHLPANREALLSYSPWHFWAQPRYLLSSDQIQAAGRTYRLDGAISAKETIAILGHLRTLLVTLAPAVLVMASLGGLFLSRRALKPVDEITDAVRVLSIRDLSGRLPVSRTGDELQRLAETWNSMLDRLQSAVERLSRFTQDASHELRTPLAIIRSTAEIASRRSRSEDAYRRALQEIVEESDRLTTLVEDLLLLARGDQPTTPETQTIDLSAIVSQVCREMAILGELRDIKLVTEISIDSAVLPANEFLIRRMLVVLLDNALKYSPSHSEVRARVTHENGSPTVEIIDCGMGIAADELTHIFDRFYRGEAAREAWMAGAGLGLSLAQTIAQQHGAIITAVSEPGRGSVFSVRFPAGSAQELPVS